jgi:crotonobetaine/carnitine-CoA ligase
MISLKDSLPPLAARTLPTAWIAACEADPSRVFLKWKESEFTYTEADRLSNGAANLLLAGGVRAGECVLVFMDNCPEYVWLLLGIAKIGAVGVPINTEAKGPLLTYYLSDSKASFAVVDSNLAATLFTASEQVRDFTQCWVRNVDESEISQAAGVLTLSIAEESQVSIAGDIEVWTPYLMMYTSGTTGPSKAVVVPHGHVMTTGAIVEAVYELNDTDCLYTCLPLFHVNAIEYTFAAAVSAKAAMALSTRFSSRAFWQHVKDFDATVTNVMGSMLQVLEKLPITEDESANGLNKIFVVPFPNDPTAVASRFGVQLMTMYGLSEWIPIAMSRPGEGYDRHFMAGPILDTSEVRIADSNDIEVPVGVEGEIVVRSAEPWTQLIEYYGKADATATAFRNGWFHTGDAGRVDSDGYLYFTGRIKDAIRRRGENISAFEVEEFLRAEPRISEVAAVPVPSDLGEDDVALFVLPRENESITAEEVAEFAAEVLPRYMLPSYIMVVAELPKTANTKVQKFKLVEWAKAHLDEMYQPPVRPRA